MIAEYVRDRSAPMRSPSWSKGGAHRPNLKRAGEISSRRLVTEALRMRPSGLMG
jgi:Flp pilus assembly CpaF family ATPase